MPTNLGIYHKLAFTGYRIFLWQKPDWNICPTGSIGILTYYDVDARAFELMREATGRYLGPKEAAEFYAKGETGATNNKTKYKPAFVNNGQYELLWTNPWYEAKKLTGGHPRIL